jgi:lipopolysaccharide biosynthesis regulator YciM
MTKPVSRQRNWQIRKLAEGKCQICGRKRDKYAWRCNPCQKQVRLRVRKKVADSA